VVLKVLVYAPLAVLGHHQETDLEIIQDHLEAGDEVFVITCNDELRELNFYACRGALRCQLCRSRRSEGIAQLKSTQKLKIIPLQPLNPVSCTADLNPLSLEAIKKFEYKGVDIGSAYVSSLVSDLRDPNPDLEKFRAETVRSVQLLAGLTDQLAQVLDSVRPDHVYFFNGRYSLYRPLLRLCQQRTIEFSVHERGSRNSMYSLTENNMGHDIDARTVEILEAWKNAPPEERERIASQWYENRARGIVQTWHSFTEQQKAELLPEGWDESKYNVVFFISSEDEFAAVPGWDSSLFSNQAEALSFLCESFQDRPGVQFYVRMHPNLRGLKNKYINDLYQLAEKFPNYNLIKAESFVSSYSLLRRAKVILSYGSTIGIEAVYWGLPSIVVGKSMYSKLNATADPKDRNELLHLIMNPQLAKGSKEGALQYSFYAASFGFPFKHYQPMSLTTGAFNGHVITGNRFVMTLSYLSVMLRDLYKILKGEYSLWLLTGKIRSKFSLFRVSRKT
jgi:hypothetical protein